MDSQMQMMNDPELSFQELKERYPKWHLPASAFFPPAPPKPTKKPEIKTDKEGEKSADGVASTSSGQPGSSSEIKQENIDPDTGEEKASPTGDLIKQEPDGDGIEIKKEPGLDDDTDGMEIKKEPVDDDADPMDESQCSSQSSPAAGGGVMDSQDSNMIGYESSQNTSLDNSQQKLNSQDSESPKSSQNHLGSSQEPIGSLLDIKTEAEEKPDVKSEMTNNNDNSNSDDDRTSAGPSSLAQRELCRAPDGAMPPKLEDGNKEMKTEGGGGPDGTAYLNPADFMRWPKVGAMLCYF